MDIRAKNLWIFKLFILLCFLIRTSATYGYCGQASPSDSTKCYTEKTRSNVIPIENGYLSSRNNSIFFIESSCNGGLSYKQACSIESAAKAHPLRTVNVLFVGAVNKSCLHTWPIKNLLSGYPNVQLYKIDLDDFLKGTPAANFLVEEDFRISTHPSKLVSDLLSFVTLYKFGGVYLDLNMIVSKPFDDLPISTDNFAGQEDFSHIGSSVFAFSKDGIGGLITSKILSYDIPFSLRTWSFKSVGIFRLVLMDICETKKIEDCKGFHLYTPYYFYPVMYDERDQYFEPIVQEIPAGHFAFNVWHNDVSYDNVYTDSLFGRLMQQYCPTIYSTLTEVPEDFL